jgi:hypothetical protein
MVHLLSPGSPHGYQPDRLAPPYENGRPVSAVDPANRQKSRFILGPRGRFDQHGIKPQRLRLYEVDACLALLAALLMGSNANP